MRQQCCRSGLFVPSFWKWQGICLQTLEVEVLSLSNRNDCSDMVCREEPCSQLCSASTTPISLMDSLVSPSSSPGLLPFSIFLAPAVISSWDSRCHQTMLSVVPSTVTGVQLTCRVRTLYCPRIWLIDLL